MVWRATTSSKERRSQECVESWIVTVMEDSGRISRGKLGTEEYLQENTIENIKNISNKIREEKVPSPHKDRPIHTEVKQTNPNRTPSNI